MPLPTNRIKKIKLPNNTEYDIVPTIIQDGSTEYSATLPTLTKDEIIATTSDLTEIVDLTDLEHASYKFSIVTEDNATYLKVEFSQGYALNYLKFTHSTTVSEVNMLLENNQYSIGSVEEVGNIFYHMTSKTNGGLENWMIVEGLYFTPETQLDEITINDISFYKVEGTFDFEN